MFIKDGTIFRKVYVRKNGTRYFVKAGKRFDVSPNRIIVNSKPSSDCPEGKERLPSGRCVKKCVPPKKRNPQTGRCKKPVQPIQQPASMPVRRTPTPVRRTPTPVRRSPTPVRRSPTPVRAPKLIDLSDGYVLHY